MSELLNNAALISSNVIGSTSPTSSRWFRYDFYLETAKKSILRLSLFSNHDSTAMALVHMARNIIEIAGQMGVSGP